MLIEYIFNHPVQIPYREYYCINQLWLGLFVCFRAEIEVVQSDVIELETRLDKVSFKHTHTF